MSEKGIVINKGKYICPKCGSTRITLHEQAIVYKHINANTNNLISRMSSRQNAFVYDNATSEGVGCWNYECRKCGWESKTYVE